MKRWARLVGVLLALFLFFVLVIKIGPLPPNGYALQNANKVKASSSLLRFAVLSDSHKGWGVLIQVMRRIAQGSYAFAVHCGDVVPFSKGDRFLFFFKKLAEVDGKPPLYFVPGNHDIWSEDEEYTFEYFKRYCAPEQYWFAQGDSVFIICNDADWTISEDRFLWLEKRLDAVRGKFNHIFVFLHIPPFDPRQGQHYCIPPEVGGRFMALMEQYRVDYVFSGHIHCYFRRVVNGVKYIFVPSAGGTPRCTQPSYGYIEIEINGDKIRDAIIEVDDDWLLELIGNIQYDLSCRRPYLLLLMLVTGQTFLYVLGG